MGPCPRTRARQRHRAEEALARVECERERFEELYHGSENAAESLRKANIVKDEFLGLVSHELRTPISTVMGNGLLLLNRGDILDPEDRILAMRDLVAEARRLGRIVENLLIVTRAEIAPPQREPLSLQHVIEDAVRAFHERNIDIPVVTHFHEDVPAADAEATLIVLVLDNLLSNADKYSPDGSEIEVSLYANSCGQPEVRVRDHGIGLDEEALANLFKPFFRAQAARCKGGGMGLGLAVCRRLVEAHNGEIRGCNHPEGGAAFSFSLEAATEN